MGAFYGSVQIRTSDHDRVKAVAEKVAGSKNIHLFLSPPHEGWISLFPENNGQDQTVAQEISRELKEDVLHLMLHDDDVLAYWFFREGDEIDSYWSLPGYFGEENRAAEEKMRGNPEVFRPIIGEKVNQLAKLLERGENGPTFASEQLDRIGKLLGIANACNAYEYLKEGERTGVKNWRQYQEIPASAVQSEKQSRAAARKRIDAEYRRLKSEGLLLLRDQRKQVMPYGCALGDGFFVAWPDHRTGKVSFSIYRAPWKEAAPVIVDTPAHITAVASDSTGHRIAMPAGQAVRVWDARGDQWNLVANIPEGDLATGVAISADGSLVAHASRQELAISEVSTTQRLHALPGRCDRFLAFHPSGNWLVAGANTLRLISIKEQSHRDFYVGGKNRLAARMTSALTSMFTQIDLEKFELEVRKSMEKRLNQMASMRSRGISEEQFESIRQDMEKNLQEQKARFADMKEGRLPPTPAQPNEAAMSLGVSRDGRWLWCGTNIGLRVYNWADVLAAPGDDMPKPAFTSELPVQLGMEFSRYIYAIAEDPTAPAILFAGGTGRIYRMDLTNGDVDELLKLPGDRAIISLSVSRDGQTLGVASHTVPTRLRAQGPRDQKMSWEIWSYPALRGGGIRTDA